MKYVKQLLMAVLFFVSSVSTIFAVQNECEHIQYYVFSWPISEGCDDTPRGGTSKGVDVDISQGVHQGWQAIQEPTLSKFERDRAAILAMAGGYRVDFDFLETVGFTQEFMRDKPYHSWGTEYVYVVEEKEEFISLQHIMVMYFKTDDGKASEPFVLKHWRQDWTYEDTSLLEYSHDNIWVNRTLDEADSSGRWSQAVFQVDDSPRYESYGRWEHNASYSTWLSSTTRRPLPRREHSVRQDYHALEGFNRHTITRHGWVQEEENWKLVLNGDGKLDSENPYLAKEQGMARYRPVLNVDFTPGDNYFKKTANFWSAVRQEWQLLINQNQKLSLRESVDGQSLFMKFFQAANEERNQQEMADFVQQTIKSYLREID